MNHHQPPEPPQRPMPLYPKAEAAAADNPRRYDLGAAAWISSAAVLFIVIIAVLVVLHDNPARTTAGVAVPTSRPGPPVPKPLAVTVPGDGIWIIGVDIERGTYQSAGGTLCYWARRADLSGEGSAILANNFKPGRQSVAMGPDDVAFESAGCGAWELMK
jgi:hypothetical protein